MHMTESAAAGIPAAIAFARQERASCVSDREWKFRLRGYGYDVQDTPRGRMLTHVVKGTEIGLI